MKRFGWHGPLLNYSPYLALALFLMLLLTSLNYFYLSAQNYQLLSSNTDQQKDIDLLQNELRETKLERDGLLNREEKRKEILEKTEEDFNKCLDDKETARNLSGSSVDSLVERVTEYQEKNERLESELVRLRGEMVNSNLSSAQLSRTIVRLREQVDSYNELDAKLAMKEYALNTTNTNSTEDSQSDIKKGLTTGSGNGNGTNIEESKLSSRSEVSEAPPRPDISTAAIRRTKQKQFKKINSKEIKEYDYMNN